VQTTWRTGSVKKMGRNPDAFATVTSCCSQSPSCVGSLVATFACPLIILNSRISPGTTVFFASPLSLACSLRLYHKRLSPSPASAFQLWFMVARCRTDVGEVFAGAVSSVNVVFIFSLRLVSMLRSNGAGESSSRAVHFCIWLHSSCVFAFLQLLCFTVHL
jgi:hypothetical protein